MEINLYDVLNNNKDYREYLNQTEKQLKPYYDYIKQIKDNTNNKINEFLKEKFSIEIDETCLNYKGNMGTLLGIFKGCDGVNIYLQVVDDENKSKIITAPLKNGTIERKGMFSNKEIYDKTIMSTKRKMDLRNKENFIVKHFKGKEYLVYGVVENSQTGEEFIAYKALYGEQKKYIRPWKEFLSEVDKSKYQDKYPNDIQTYKFEWDLHLEDYGYKVGENNEKRN